jgi:hypothetical protein
MIHMYVQAPPQYENMQLMGDSIAQLPFIYAMSQKDKIEITGGFNVHVMELTKGWNVEFQPLFDRADGSILLYASEALSTHIQTGRRLYMGQCYIGHRHQPFGAYRWCGTARDAISRVPA